MRYDEEKELIFLLEQIEDPRHARGIRYRFADLLLICIYAVLAGHSEGSDIAFYAELNFEYFKEKTVIFSEKLPIGTYTFTIPLLPRFTGKYTLNPAKVELMYFPVVNANNEGKRIWITERNTKE